ncbi:thylakoid lumenal 17.4 kDa protein [Cymbomonas tetramitiformis]|uniref:Thylakoid lumenal 17.4 kDa protein n=1 Tax=Cymbomonas tetramitiformis TaxID=36881 RepID=A0AAE0EYN1_9CHLO|nr:thylakoid lumenal 17.4 kDa protein [Cymbomonas tetramitiformis]
MAMSCKIPLACAVQSAKLSSAKQLKGARPSAPRANQPSKSIVCHGDAEQDRKKERSAYFCGLCAAVGMFSSAPAWSAMKLPPLDTDPAHCERAFIGNTIGQANAVSDKVLDMRQCNFDGKDLSTTTLSGGLMNESTYRGTNMQEVVMSKAYAVGSDFSGADFTNAVVDRVFFAGANLSNAKFINAVITGTDFEGANLEGADFEDALIGNEDVKRICGNPTVLEDMRDIIGCR